MNIILAFITSVFETVVHESATVLLGLVSNATKEVISKPSIGIKPTLIARGFQQKSVDGGLVSGPRGKEWAKFTLKKGLPTDESPRRMAIENVPHSVDDFDGEIKEGYGKGFKELTYSGRSIVKLEKGSRVSRVNVHLHRADRAGEHTDIVIEGVQPGTSSFEINIPNGNSSGRYAFRQTFEKDEYLVVRMKDRSVLEDKPDIHLKLVEFLQSLRKEGGSPVTVEWKADGSFASAAITSNHVAFRSHRPEAKPYYDKLPAIEDVSNHSPVFLARTLFPGPQLEGTVFKGELFHPDGAARVGGILNALPANARDIQAARGPTSYVAWDITYYKGRNVKELPYEARRQLYTQAIEDIRNFNKHWHSVKALSKEGDPVAFYNDIIRDPKGLPYSEGVVVKYSGGSTPYWFKVKANDTYDLRVIRFIPGRGKYAGTLGAILVEGPGGSTSEVGSFQITDQQRQWIWDNRSILEGQVAEIRAMDITKSGAVRAGVFYRWHPTKSEAGLLMYSEGLAGSTDPEVSIPTMYAVKSSAGWRKKG